jgi:hypothetical protein
MYYPDLTPYDYGTTEYKDALNIGWIEMGREFPTGDFPEKQELLRKLKEKRIENKYRGWHDCDFCECYEDKIDSTGNIGTFLIFDRTGNGEYIVQWNGKTYAAPMLVVHYIDSHNYRPPQEFIDAVMNEKEYGAKI